MTELQLPHERFLHTVYNEVVRQAGIGIPTVSLDERHRLQVTYEGGATDAAKRLNEYFVYSKDVKNYFADSYGQYRMHHDDRLDGSRFRFAQADLMWTLAVVAVTNSFIKDCSNELSGALHWDLHHVGLVHAIGKFAIAKDSVGTNLAMLNADGVLDVTQDNEHYYKDYKGRKIPKYRYAVKKPKGGMREIVNERKAAERKSFRFIPRTA